MADCVKQSGAEESDYEGLRNFRAWLKLQRPKNEHPNRSSEELKRSEKPWEREDVENLLVVDIEDDVLEIPEPEHDGELKGFAIGGGIGGGIAAVGSGSGGDKGVGFRRKNPKWVRRIFAESARFGDWIEKLRSGF